MLSQPTSRGNKFKSALFKLVSFWTIKLLRKVFKQKRNDYFHGFCVVLETAIPHNVTFDVSGDYATVTWKITGDFIVKSYYIYLFHSSSFETLGNYYPVTNTSPMTYTLKLVKGVLYDIVAVYVNSDTSCGVIREKMPGTLQIHHLTGNKVFMFYLLVRIFKKKKKFGCIFLYFNPGYLC